MRNPKISDFKICHFFLPFSPLEFTFSGPPITDPLCGKILSPLKIPYYSLIFSFPHLEFPCSLNFLVFQNRSDWAATAQFDALWASSGLEGRKYY